MEWSMYIHKFHTAVFIIHAKIDSCYKKKWCLIVGYQVYNPAAFIKEKYFLHPTGRNYSVLKSLTLTNIIQASKKLTVGSDIIHGAFIRL